MKVNKRLMSFALGLVMITNGLAANAVQTFAKDNKEQTISSETDDIKANINGHDYIINDEGATYVLEEETGLSYLDYESSIMGTDFDAWGAVEALDKSNNNHMDYDSPSVGERFYVSRDSYNRGKMAGICISEYSGHIDWNLFSKLYDFAYINCYDFRTNNYDENLDENVKECEKYGITYGLSAIVDFKYYDDVDVESIDDAKLLSKIVSEYNSELPTLLKIDNTDYSEVERLPDEYGLADYIMSDTNYYSTMAASYLKGITSIFGSAHGNSYAFTMTEEVYQKIIEINNNFPDEKYLTALNIASFVSIYDHNSNANYKVSQDKKLLTDVINGDEIDYEKIYINDKELASNFFELDSDHRQIVKKAYLRLLAVFGISGAAFVALLAGTYKLLSQKNKNGSALTIRKK